jgi:hypothetical protein
MISSFIASILLWKKVSSAMAVAGAGAVIAGGVGVESGTAQIAGVGFVVTIPRTAEEVGGGDSDGDGDCCPWC